MITLCVLRRNEMNKRLISLLLCLVLIVACFAGCAEKSDEDAISDTNEAASESAITLAMYLLCEKEVSPEQEAAIEKAANAITNQKKIKLDLFYYTADEYYEALEESFAARLEAEAEGLIKPPVEDEGGEDEMYKDDLGVSHILYPTIDSFQVDIFYVGGYEQFIKYMDFPFGEDGDSEMMYSKLDEQITSSAKVLEDSISPSLLQYMKSMNNGTYAVPTNTAIGEYTYLLLNKDVLAKTRYNTPAGLSQFTSLTCAATRSVLSQVAESYNEYVPLYSCLGEDGLAVSGVKYWGVDENGVPCDDFSILSSSYSTSAVYGTPSSYLGSIDNLMGSSYFTNQLTYLKQYKSYGYFGTEKDFEDGNVAVAYMKGSADIPAKYAENYEAVIIENPTLTTEQVYSDMFAVSSYTASVKRSMDVLCMLNTDEQLRNIILYGIEGENYELVDSDYLDENDEPYKVVRRLNDNYIMDVNKTGNTFKAYPLEGDDPTLLEFYKIQNNSVQISLTMGLHFGWDDYVVDPDKLQEIRRISAEVLEDIAAIDCTNDTTIRNGINAIRNKISSEDVIYELIEVIEPGRNDTTCTLGYVYDQWALEHKLYEPDDE